LKGISTNELPSLEQILLCKAGKYTFWQTFSK